MVRVPAPVLSRVPAPLTLLVKVTASERLTLSVAAGADEDVPAHAAGR